MKEENHTQRAKLFSKEKPIDYLQMQAWQQRRQTRTEAASCETTRRRQQSWCCSWKILFRLYVKSIISSKPNLRWAPIKEWKIQWDRIIPLWSLKYAKYTMHPLNRIATTGEQLRTEASPRPLRHIKEPVADGERSENLSHQNWRRSKKKYWGEVEWWGWFFKNR